jgi:hypothetical protein
MAGQAMPDWEDILNAYLEGRGLRADAEDLLMRLHLSAQDREQIERSLRLADEIHAALRPIQPPADLQARLTAVLSACPMPAGVPANWESDRDASAEEDLLDAALEGRVSLEELYAAQAAGRLSESGREALEDLEASAGGVAEVSLPMSGSIPAGLEGRLQEKLRAHMHSEEGEVDQRVVNRLLAKRPKERGPQIVMPDVLAAGEEPEKTEE